VVLTLLWCYLYCGVNYTVVLTIMYFNYTVVLSILWFYLYCGFIYTVLLTILCC